MRIALDTNVLAYAEGFDDDVRNVAAAHMITSLAANELVLPVQVAAELFRVVTKKFRREATEARRIVERWRGLCPILPASTRDTFALALELADRHRFQIFDAIILAASAEAGCRLLLSEDRRDGFVWRGVTVANPFAATPHPLLADALRL